MTAQKAYFVYFDADSQNYYFYDTVSQETTFDRPTDAPLFDPLTREPFVFPDSVPPAQPQPEPEAPPQPAPEPSVAEEPDVSFQPEMAGQASWADLATAQSAPDEFPELRLRPDRSGSVVMKGKRLVIDPPKPVQGFREDAVQLSPGVTRQSSFFPDPRNRALPSDLQGDIQRFQMADYAKEFFREHRSGNSFSRKKISMDAITRFQSEPLKVPLLQAHSRTSAKAAIDLFRQIMLYTGADPTAKGKPGTALVANRIVGMTLGIVELRDEIYFQLIKQTRENPNPECLKLTWDLFLIIATLVPSSRNSENWIKAHLFQSSRDATDPVISDIAQFAFIRFTTRCLIGKPFGDSVPLPVIQTIPGEVLGGHKVFGASIYEQLWHQRKKYPDAPVPVILHEMTEALLEKGCERREGPFRLPGNGMKVKQMQESINNGGNPLPAAEFNDVASLFKSWFSLLPQPIVDKETLPSLRTAFELKTYVMFVADLPPAHGFVLKFLIGFLKRLVIAEPVTRMSAKNYAICFAPNLVDTENVTDTTQATFICDMAIEFICQLVNTWDTREIYPMKRALLGGQ
jgi:hypothetical protein